MTSHACTSPLAHRCRPPRGDQRGLALPPGTGWTCRCGTRWRLNHDSQWTRTK